MMRTIIAAAAIVATIGAATAWPSGTFGVIHTRLTETAIAASRIAEIAEYRDQLVEGANQELHELPLSGRPMRYGIDLESARLAHKGTNAGTDDIRGWWADSLTAYRAGDKPKAYFILGILAHMIEDMGVPAHANGLVHQAFAGTDHFEAMSVLNWKPELGTVNKADPGYADPSAYYAFSQRWTREDAPTYLDTSSFSLTWAFASDAERALLANREARTAATVQWALQAAYKAFTAR
jgi:hypothetical protein